MLLPLWKAVWQFHKRLNVELHVTQNPTSRCIFERTKSRDISRYLCISIHCSIIDNNQKAEVALVPFDRLVDK